MNRPQFSLKTMLWTIIRWLRWAAVLALACCALGVPAPAPLAAVQNLVFMFIFYGLRETGFVVAGAMIAPRARLATAIVLAAVQVLLSFRGHVLSMGGPWWFWTINYTHSSLEAFGAVLGVVYIFWLEKAKGPVASIPPPPPPE